MESEKQNTEEEEQNQNLQALKQFTGTEEYYSSSFRTLNLTSGIHYLRESLKCYWLIDIVESIQYLKAIKDNKSFIIHQLKINPDSSGVFNSYSDYSEEDTDFNKQNLLYTQIIPYTDFKLKEGISFYQQGNVLLLKSEY